MARRSCKGQNRKGEPCKSAPMKTSDYCHAHNTEIDADKRFGSPQQAREAATGVQRRYPRLREQVAKQLEEHAERIVGAQIEGLDATRAVVVGEGEDAYVEHHPDYLTRLRAGDTLLSRALGKPGTMEEHVSDSPLVNINLVTDADLRSKATDLRRRLASDRTIEPSRLGAGD